MIEKILLKEETYNDEGIESIIGHRYFETSIDMFLYLIFCSNELQYLFTFIEELTLNESPTQILLTLNRLIKWYESPGTIDYRPAVAKIINKAFELFRPEYKRVKGRNYNILYSLSTFLKR